MGAPAVPRPRKKKAATHRKTWQICEDLTAHVSALRGLCEMYEAHQAALEEIVQVSAGGALWGPGGFLMRTPGTSARTEAWHRRGLVLMDAEAHLLTAFDGIVGELGALADQAVA